MSIFHAGLQPALDEDGNPINGATWNFYRNGTTTAQAVYDDDGDSLGAVITANSAGRFASAYFDDTLRYRAILKDQLGGTIRDIADINALNLGQIYSVTDYGAVGNNTADDTAAIQAAITACGAGGGGIVFFPPGFYKTTSALTVTSHYVCLMGCGAAGLIMPSGTGFNVIYAYPASGANLQGFKTVNLHVYGGSDSTSGAILRIDRCNGWSISNCSFQNWYGGILVDGSVHGYIDGTDLRADQSFASYRSGSYLFKTVKGSDGTTPAEIHVSSADWRGSSGNNYLDYAVLLTAVDGIWFDNPHLGFCKSAALGILPATDTSHMTSVIVRGGYLDTVQDSLLQCYRPSSGYSADFGLHSLDFATNYNSGSHGFDWNCQSTGNNFWSDIQIGNMLKVGSTGVNVTLGQKLWFKPGWAIMEPSYTTASKHGIEIANASAQIRIGGGTVDKGTSPNTPATGLTIGASVDKIEVDVIHAISCTAALTDNSVTANKSIASAVTW